MRRSLRTRRGISSSPTSKETSTIRPARAGLVICLVVLAHSAPLLAQEVRSLPDADRVPLHSSVDVSRLPAPRAVADSERAQIKVRPRLPRNPDELQRLKELLREAAPKPFATAETVEVPAPALASSVLSVVSSFEGLADLQDNAVTGFSFVPSDANLAVGLNHVFEMVNIVGRITNKSGGAASTFALRSFFQLDPGSDESDPRVIYDAASGRWFATYLQSSKTQSSVILAVSTTGDPTGIFCRFRLGNPTSETFLQDFPQIGISDDKVIVTYNAFTLATSSFLGAGYYVINKGDLVTAGCPPSVRRVRIAPNPARYGVQPAPSLSSTGTLYMATNDGPVPGGGRVIVFGVSGVPGVSTVTEDSFEVNVKSWLPPPNAEQPGSAVRLNTNNESVITAVWQGGALWIGGNEQCLPGGDSMPRSCLRVIQIQTDAHSLQQDITFGFPGQYYYYPAVSPDGAGNLVVVFNASSATDFAGVRATGRLATDPPNTLVASMLLRPGGGAQTGPDRMGDYYGAALDPADPSKVWVTAEYIRATADRDWGTFVAQLTFGPPPTLALALNSHTFKTGDTLKVNLTVGNPGAALSVDVYFGLAVPPAAGPALGCPLGDAILFASGSLTNFVIRCASGSPASFPLLVARASIPAGLALTVISNFFALVWPAAPAGPYTIFMVWAVPGSFLDGGVVPSDVIALGADAAIFSP